MTCEEVRALLPAHAIAACDVAEAAAVDGHLRRCPACRAEQTRAVLVAEALAFLPDPAPVPARVHTAVRRATRRPRAPRWAGPRRLVAGLAAAALVGIGVGAARLIASGAPPADPFARSAAMQNAQVAGTLAAALAAAAPTATLAGPHGMHGQVVIIRPKHLLVVVAEHLPSGWYHVWLRAGGRWHRMSRFAADRHTRCLVAVPLAGRPVTVAVTDEHGRPERPMLVGALTAA